MTGGGGLEVVIIIGRIGTLDGSYLFRDAFAGSVRVVSMIERSQPYPWTIFSAKGRQSKVR
jgi:hypothetical protein